MTYVALVMLGQLADLLSFLGDMRLGAVGREVGPLAPVLATFGVHGVLFVKLAALVAIGLGALALERHPRLLAALALVGFAGAITNLSAFL